MSEMKNQIKQLVTKAVEIDNSPGALRFSQAALNVAHAMRLLYDMEPNIKDVRKLT